MMDNVWILTNKNDWENSVAEYFKRENLWENVYIKYRGQLEEQFIDHYIPENIYDEIYKFLPQFIDMFSRNSNIDQNTYAELNYHDFLNIFNLYINYYYNTFLKNRITLFITNRAPHVGLDFIAYLVAEKMGIKTVIMEQSLFPNKFFLYSNHTDYGDFSTSKEVVNHENLVLKKDYKKDLFYMKIKKLSPVDKIKKSYVQNKIVRLTRELISKNNRGQAFYRFYQNKMFEKNKNKYEQNVDLENDRFVYFALHLQPEKTTSSWGGKYVDQLLAIERLSKKLPPNVKIYIKENPKQGFFMRGHYFYERLKKIKNTVLVPNDTNTYQLIEKSLFVSTITGTVGWEAISGGKNVLVFGWGVWYKKLPGVFSFDENFDFQTILDYKISHKDLESELNNILKKTGEGVVYTKGNGYKSIVLGYSVEQNIKNLSSSLRKYLYNE